MDNKLFTSLGKLKHGEEATHKAFEDQIGKITALQTKVSELATTLLSWRKMLKAFEIALF